ncbi:hypothetical protein NKI54_06100 [Mesorhizobium sp. M0663]|uniref:hypothetical protein n=1 Tax=Mesorhizobium sp. M0663 TaxID=2956981 RepID=UPI0033354CE6
MRKNIVVVATCILIWTGSPSFAEPDACVLAYHDNVRNISFDDSNYEASNSLFDQFCKSDGHVRDQYFNTKFSMGGDAAIDGNTQRGEKEQSLTKFCEKYVNIRYSNETMSSRKSIVVTDALKSLNECEEILNKTKVQFTYSSTQNGMSIHVEFPKGIKFYLDDVVATPGVVCTTNNPDESAGAPPVITLTGDNGRIHFEEDVNIVCKRHPLAEPSGNLTYSPASILIVSSVPSFSVNMTQDTVYSAHLASDATSRISSLEENLKAQTEKTTALQNDVESWKARFDSLRVVPVVGFSGKNNPGQRGPEFGASASPDAIKQALCTNATKSDIIRYGHDGDHDYYAAACVFEGAK